MIGVNCENEKPCDGTDEVIPLIQIRPLTVPTPPSTATTARLYLSPSLNVVSLLQPSGFAPLSLSSPFRENEKPCEGTDEFVL